MGLENCHYTLLSASISFSFQCSNLNGFFSSVSIVCTFFRQSYSTFFVLSLALTTRVSSFFTAPSRYWRSFWTNSLAIISRSRVGFTSPSTWMTSSSSNALHRWKSASQAETCERKAFPRPCPSEAPFTKPAMSTTFRNAGT
ncbi:hypothetical protein PMAYCL1PPCAC_23514 [Pristionchus mayeri]|uniref:Uncharacterized protein n=1 Tax=Pristionchus mayeri TaxID=1317129 RepID=A0AAN5D0E6_9BILA|nr:hypothetical protein PMAYCL1PPCAC_23514 [Pristionchus mayeri]